MIPFNVPPCVGEEIEYVQQAIASHKICGDGAFTKQCNAWLEERFHAQKVLLTTSGTTALDMAMLLCDLKPGDEVILPSYTFSSTATVPVLCRLGEPGTCTFSDTVVVVVAYVLSVHSAYTVASSVLNLCDPKKLSRYTSPVSSPCNWKRELIGAGGASSSGARITSSKCWMIRSLSCAMLMTTR